LNLIKTPVEKKIYFIEKYFANRESSRIFHVGFASFKVVEVSIKEGRLDFQLHMTFQQTQFGYGFAITVHEYYCLLLNIKLDILHFIQTYFDYTWDISVLIVKSEWI
jgi:hypothetical protein